jgi:two-component system, LytTR family, sensor histidine kinase AlgZ
MIDAPPSTTASAFGSTGFDAAAAPRPRVAGGTGSAFDMCHGGVVLRAVLFVHVVLAIGVLFGAAGFEQWLTRLALGTGIALPGVLLWLVLSCLLKAPLARASVGAQFAAAGVLGALCAAASWALQEAVGLDLLSGAVGALRPWPWLAPALAGAALASALLYWLRLRAIAQGPADTSARLAELQSRIRPHFLFNTLNTAITLARIDPKRTEELLEDLAELFRVALADADAAVTLGSEVELAQRYLAIEQIRFGERLRVTWELDPAAAPARVPPLLLQPLVENAVRHGVEPAPDGGQIRVRTRVRRGQVVLSIDNSLHQQAPSRPGAGMALRNVRERLHLMHDVAGHFDARAEGDVFRVRIELPLESRA